MSWPTSAMTWVAGGVIRRCYDKFDPLSTKRPAGTREATACQYTFNDQKQ